MSNLTHREVFDAQIEAFVNLDADGLVALFADDGVLIDMHEPDKEMHGKQGYGDYVREGFRHLRNLRNETTSYVENGNRIAGETTLSGTFLVEPDNEDGPQAEFVVHYCLVEVIEDGLVKREHVYSDSAELAKYL